MARRARNESQIYYRQGIVLTVPDIRELISVVDFPAEANCQTNDPHLRAAMWNAFEGRDYYSGCSISKRNMSIDHVTPQSHGGPDNIYNYVLTTHRNNSKINCKMDSPMVYGVLYFIRVCYAPKALRLYQYLLSGEMEIKEAVRIERMKNRFINPVQVAFSVCREDKRRINLSTRLEKETTDKLTEIALREHVSLYKLCQNIVLHFENKMGSVLHEIASQEEISLSYLLRHMFLNYIEMYDMQV